MSILDEIKVYCEVEDTDQYDNQLIQLANLEIGYLMNNKIPVTPINATTISWESIAEKDYHVVIAYVGLSVLRRFDRTLFTDSSYTTKNWIDGELEDLLYQLKCIYDSEVIS